MKLYQQIHQSISQAISQALSQSFGEWLENPSKGLEFGALEASLNENKNQHFDEESIQNLNISLRELPSEVGARSILLFKVLTSHFSAGVLLLRTPDEKKFEPKALFKNGKMLPPFTKNPFGQIELKTISLARVLEAKTETVLTALDLSALDTNKNLRAFLFALNNDIAFLLLSNKADLWLSSHIEDTHKLIMKAMGDL